MAFKHGHSRRGRKTPEYRAWSDMLRRCYNPSLPNYPDYGGRGIQVFAGWHTDFKAFLDHIGPKPREGKLSLDRINNDGNYEPGNVRWASLEIQQNNTTWNHVINICGYKMTLSQAARKFKLNRHTVRSRYVRGHRDLDVVKPLKGEISLLEVII